MKNKIYFLRILGVFVLSIILFVSCQKSTDPDDSGDDGNTDPVVTAKIIDIKSNGSDAVYLTNTGFVYSLVINYQSGYQTLVKSKVTGLQDIVKIACGPHYSGRGRGIALDKDGKIYTWEFDPYTAVAEYVTLYSNMSTFTSKIIDIAVGGLEFSFTYALDQSGKVWAWGDNAFYQLGNTGGGQTTPAIISGLPNDISAIAAGSRQGIALSSGGNVYHWGYINTASADMFSTPQLVTDASPASAVSAGNNYNLAKKTNGTVYAWGHLNNGIVPGITSPTVLAAGFEVYFNPMFIKSDGTIWKTSFSMASGDPTTAEAATDLASFRFSLLSVNTRAFYVTTDGKILAQLSYGTTPLELSNPLQ